MLSESDLAAIERRNLAFVMDIPALLVALRAARSELDAVRDFLIRAQVMIPGGQPEFRECREWIDRLAPYDRHEARLAGKTPR